MELVKNIFFNTDKLIQSSNVKISYTGKLFQNGSEEVFIHYGFGDNWDNVSDIPMNKTELGFQAELQLNNSDKLNLCFRNSNNEWDNNNNENYTFTIEKKEVALVPQSTGSELDAPRRLRRTYIWSKKVRLAIYKIIHYLPKLISGNYKRKALNGNNN